MSNEFRWGDIGVIGALIVNIVIGTWEIAQIDGAEKSDARDILRVETEVDTLNASNSAKDIHLSQLDDAVNMIKDNIASLLSITTHTDNAVTGGDNIPPNFISPQKKK